MVMGCAPTGYSWALVGVMDLCGNSDKGPILLDPLGVPNLLDVPNPFTVLLPVVEKDESEYPPSG